MEFVICNGELIMDLVDLAYERVSEFYTPDYMKGIIQVILEDQPQLNHYYHFSDRVDMKRGIHAHYTTKITLPKAIYENMLQEPELFDPRRAFFTNSVTSEGDVSLRNYFTQLFKRPDGATVTLLNQSRGKQYSEFSHVAQLADFNEDMVKDSLFNNVPLHGKKLLHWEALNWSLDELENKFGDFQLRLYSETLEKQFDAHQITPLSGKPHVFSNFMKELKDPKNKIAYSAGRQMPAELNQYFKFPFFDEQDLCSAKIWLGKQRDDIPVTNLHCEFKTGILGQVWGTKKIHLYAPGDYKHLYPVESYNNYQPCLIDLPSPCKEKYPDFYKAKVFEVILEPGDFLMIPIGWYHCVWALNDTFSVSRFIEINPFAED